jgi:ABC-type antimicrobial peptide transport system permease subunit
MYSRTDLGIIAPKSAQNKVNKYYSLNEDNFFSGRTILEFTDYNKMNEFSNENLCLNFLASNSNCSMDNLMVVNEFGSTPLRWENIKNNLNGIIVGVSIFFSLISIIILVGTFSKIFLDEQKTSAIFQAIGATRRDIFKIYATYAVILAIFVAIMVQIIGYFGAFLIQIWQSSQSTAELKIDFNLINSAVNLNFIGFTPQALWISVVAVISVLLSFLFVSRKISTKDIIKTLKE